MSRSLTRVKNSSLHSSLGKVVPASSSKSTFFMFTARLSWNADLQNCGTMAPPNESLWPIVIAMKDSCQTMFLQSNSNPVFLQSNFLIFLKDIMPSGASFTEGSVNEWGRCLEKSESLDWDYLVVDVIDIFIFLKNQSICTDLFPDAARNHNHSNHCFENQVMTLWLWEY